MRRRKSERTFFCTLFLDDASIVEEKMTADSPETAVSLLLSAEAGRRKVPYCHLREHVLPGGALAKEESRK
jgi:hypothetical protein